jgi:hypothetical protein
VGGKRVENCLEIQPEAPGFDHDLFNFFLQQPRTRRGRGAGRLRHDGPDADADFDQAFRKELRNHFVRGIRIDLQFLTEQADGRKRITGSHLSGEHGLARHICDLFVQGDAGLESYAERNHLTCTITRSTRKYKRTPAASPNRMRFEKPDLLPATIVFRPPSYRKNEFGGGAAEILNINSGAG